MTAIQPPLTKAVSNVRRLRMVVGCLEVCIDEGLVVRSSCSFLVFLDIGRVGWQTLKMVMLVFSSGPDGCQLLLSLS